MSKIAKLLRLSPGEQLLLGRAVVVVAAIHCALMLLPFRRLRPLLIRAARPRRTPPVGRAGAERIAWAVATAARVLSGPSCMSQALATQILLARAGEASDLRIGVARNGAHGVRAHAWLETRGEVIIGDPLAGDLIALPLLHGGRYEPLSSAATEGRFHGRGS